jgi:hypothetical protein
MELLQKANELLGKLADVGERIAGLQIAAEKEMAAVKRKYEDPIGKFKDIQYALDAELIKLMKWHKGDLFDRTDQVALEAGILLYGEEAKVRIPRDAVAKLEELKWEDGLKRTVSVNREAIEKWPLERILTIGGDKKVVEVYSYELTAADRRRQTADKQTDASGQRSVVD